jgi:hypothetical protein
MTLARDGAQAAAWQYARVKAMPSRANLSRLGVLMPAVPKQPSSGRRSSTMMNSTLGRAFFEGDCPDGAWHSARQKTNATVIAIAEMIVRRWIFRMAWQCIESPMTQPNRGNGVRRQLDQ